MRAKTVPYKKAYVWDFDDTLFKTDSKIDIIKDGRKVKSITPDEFKDYNLQDDEFFDFQAFDDPRYILNAKPYKMWPVLKNVDMAKKSARSNSDIYILTARSPRSIPAIYALLKRKDIDIPKEHIYAIGDDNATKKINALKKKEILQELTYKYDEVMFFDDSEDNIDAASRVPGVKTRLIEFIENI
jgi:FMN phosphatase YigB (HAD superfamily)